MHFKREMEAYPGPARPHGSCRRDHREKTQGLSPESSQTQSRQTRSPASGLRLKVPFRKDKQPPFLSHTEPTVVPMTRTGRDSGPYSTPPTSSGALIKLYRNPLFSCPAGHCSFPLRPSQFSGNSWEACVWSQQPPGHVSAEGWHMPPPPHPRPGSAVTTSVC